MRNLSQYQPYQQSWVLPLCRAQTLVPATAGVLRVTSGRAWVTLGQGPAGDDVFLAGHASLALQAGQVVVLESWPPEPAAQLGLVWEAVAEGTANRHWQQALARLSSFRMSLPYIGVSPFTLSTGCDT